jgi:hypothetical protein
MNSFYSQPRLLQWAEALVLVLAGFYVAMLIIEQAYINSAYYLLFFVYLPVGQFSLTPLFKLTGVYRYYSPMLLGYMPNTTLIDLHNGGSFDYLFVMRSQQGGVPFRNRILAYHLEGLLHLIAQIEAKKLPDTVVICGTSYFFSERTMTKLGFRSVQPSAFYRLNLLVNAIDLLWMYSLSQGRLAMPKIWDAKKATIVGGELVLRKELITQLHRKLAHRSDTDGAK